MTNARAACLTERPTRDDGPPAPKHIPRISAASACRHACGHACRHAYRHACRHAYRHTHAGGRAGVRESEGLQVRQGIGGARVGECWRMGAWARAKGGAHVCTLILKTHFCRAHDRVLVPCVAGLGACMRARSAALRPAAVMAHAWRDETATPTKSWLGTTEDEPP